MAHVPYIAPKAQTHHALLNIPELRPCEEALREAWMTAVDEIVTNQTPPVGYRVRSYKILQQGQGLAADGDPFKAYVTYELIPYNEPTTSATPPTVAPVIVTPAPVIDAATVPLTTPGDEPMHPQGFARPLEPDVDLDLPPMPEDLSGAVTEKPKRKRRTKAEIEADKAFLDAAKIPATEATIEQAVEATVAAIEAATRLRADEPVVGHSELMRAAGEDHAERKHHPYSMSKLNYLDDCAGFTSNSGTSDAAEEGTMLHEVVEAILAAWFAIRDDRPTLTLVQLFSETVEEGFSPLVDEAGEALPWHDDGQKGAVREMLTLIDWWIPSAAEVFVEEKYAIYNPDGSVLTYGHSDLIIGYADMTATGIDYKFGRGKLRPADTNLQGKGYALSFLQNNPEYKSVTWIFKQPRINVETKATFTREQMGDLYHEINDVIARAQNSDKALNTGHQCSYCAVAANCTQVNNMRALVAAKYLGLPMPQTFQGSLITDPGEMALAMWWAKRAEPAIDEIKKATTRMAAENPEAALQCEVNGKIYGYALRERSEPRKVGAAPLVYAAVRDTLTAEQFTGAVAVKIGELEEIFADVAVEKAKEQGVKLTKKAAVAELNDRLILEGLVSTSEIKIQFLKEIEQETVVPASE